MEEELGDLEIGLKKEILIAEKELPGYMKRVNFLIEVLPGKIELAYEKFGFLPKILPNKELFYKTDLNRFNQFVSIFKNIQNSTYICADEEPKKLFEVLGLKKKVKYFPVPWVLIYVTLKILEVMSFNPKFRSDSLISIWGEKA